MKKNNKNVHLIVGDLILDRFIYGHVERISPEAPSLVLDADHKLDLLGGAYNVVSHLCSLGDNCHIISAVGNDFESIMSSFDAKFQKSCTQHFFTENNRTTSIKTRLVSIYKLAHLLRFDSESKHDINKGTEDLIYERCCSLINQVKTIILVDYRKGVVTSRLARMIIELAIKNNKPVFVDTKCDDLTKFQGASLIKPNKHEFDKILLRHSNRNGVERSCFNLLNNLNIGCIVKTAGDDGIYSYTKFGESYHIRGVKVEVKELSGAGDSVLAVLSYCYAANYSFLDALKCANKIASKFVSSGAGYTAKIEHLFINKRL